ncbi:MAG: GxxExxY protein [Chitinophagaceae bacterium]
MGERKVDFFVEKASMVALKALINFENVHLAKAKNYLEASNIEVGLLINFGSTSLQFKRLGNQKFKGSLLSNNP